MSRVVIPPKLSAEIRLDRLDFSPFLAAGVSVTGATATSSVWTGTDVTPLVLTPTPASPFVNVLTSGGTVGVIYQVRVLATLSDAEQVALTYYLAIIPDVA